jgi:excisionase family DNA binding protein
MTISHLLNTAAPQQPMTFQVWSDEQIHAFKQEIIDAVAETLSTNWLPRRPMTPDELAEYMHVSRETVRRWTISGALKSWQHGAVILYLPDDIAAFLGRAPEQASDAA